MVLVLNRTHSGTNCKSHCLRRIWLYIDTFFISLDWQGVVKQVDLHDYLNYYVKCQKVLIQPCTTRLQCDLVFQKIWYSVEDFTLDFLFIYFFLISQKKRNFFRYLDHSEREIILMNKHICDLAQILLVNMCCEVLFLILWLLFYLSQQWVCSLEYRHSKCGLSLLNAYVQLLILQHNVIQYCLFRCTYLNLDAKVFM